MSKERLQSNGNRWLRQALDDLSASEVLLEGGKYAQSSFSSQQAAEKAMKAVRIVLDRDPWGQSVTRLITDLDEPNRSARGSSRGGAPSGQALHPDALAELTPGAAYTAAEAREALRHAGGIIARVREWMERSR